jgi:acetyl-CoA synthetase
VETPATAIYREARDLLQDLSRDYKKAVEEFVWPEFGERFNWAIDWFDANARGNDGTALWIVEEDGSEVKLSFAEMARRSDRPTWPRTGSGAASTSC